MRRVILSRALVIGRRLAAFNIATAYWMVTCCGVDIVDKSQLLDQFGTDHRRTEVCHESHIMIETYEIERFLYGFHVESICDINITFATYIPDGTSCLIIHSCC